MKKKLAVGLFLCVIAAAGFASESDGIFPFRVGQIEVFMLVEAERDGNAGIIPGADEAVLRRYIPGSGFKHSANAYLIKAYGKNILIDTGTGAGGIIIEKIKKLGVTPEQVDAVLLTHLHGDHFGSLQKDGKAVFTKAKIYLDARERDHFTRIAVNQGAVAALAPYGSNVVNFDAAPLGPISREILPGICAVANYGHTPGHTVFLVTSGVSKLLIGGDFLHVALVQFPHPEISATYDIDQKAAANSRRQLMEYAAAFRIPLGGMHIVYPGIGMVEADGNGFAFTPAR
jgi:glyoxylase-like metal-dependent hydrolase (beta-lactamase superfamily II)